GQRVDRNDGFDADLIFPGDVPERIARFHHVGALHARGDDELLPHHEAVGILELVESDEVLHLDAVQPCDGGQRLPLSHDVGAGLALLDNELLSHHQAVGVTQFVELYQVVNGDTVAAADVPQGFAPLHHVENAALRLGARGQRQRYGQREARRQGQVQPTLGPAFSDRSPSHGVDIPQTLRRTPRQDTKLPDPSTMVARFPAVVCPPWRLFTHQGMDGGPYGRPAFLGNIQVDRRDALAGEGTDQRGKLRDLHRRPCVYRDQDGLAHPAGARVDVRIVRDVRRRIQEAIALR